MKGFCYMYSLQVGVAIIAACGLTLTTTTVVVNIFRTAVSVEEDANDALSQSIVQYFLFLTFVVLGYVTFIFALMGAYKEEIKQIKIAKCTMLIQFILWLVLSILSFVPAKALEWTCVQSIRCADTFFIHNAYYKKSMENPEFSFRYHTDETPSQEFENEQECLKHCKTDKAEDEPNRGRGAEIITDAPLLADNTTKTTPAANLSVSEATDNIVSKAHGSTNVTKKESARPKTSDGSKFYDQTFLRCIATTVAIKKLKNESNKFPPSPRNGTCKCHKQKKKLDTLIGPQDSLGHFILSIVFTILIAIFWYLYSICTLWSYINFLKTPPRGSKISKTSGRSLDLMRLNK